MQPVLQPLAAGSASTCSGLVQSVNANTSGLIGEPKQTRRTSSSRHRPAPASTPAKDKTPRSAPQVPGSPAHSRPLTSQPGVVAGSARPRRMQLTGLPRALRAARFAPGRPAHAVTACRELSACGRRCWLCLPGPRRGRSAPGTPEGTVGRALALPPRGFSSRRADSGPAVRYQGLQTPHRPSSQGAPGGSLAAGPVRSPGEAPGKALLQGGRLQLARPATPMACFVGPYINLFVRASLFSCGGTT